MTIKKLVKSVPVDKIIERDFSLDRGASRYIRAIAHDSLVIDLEQNIFYWNSVGISGNALDWLRKIKGMSMMDSLKLLRDYSGIPYRKNYQFLFQPCYPYSKLLDVFYNLGKSNRDYWYSRGYTDDTINKFKLGFTGNSYVIPVVHEDILRNFQCRTPEKNIWMWTKELREFPFNFKILNTTDWVVITESPVDCILLEQYNIPAISVMPNALSFRSEYLKYLAHIKNIYLFFDNDPAGYAGMVRIGKKFKSRCFVVDWKGFPYKYDVGDLLKGAKEGKLMHKMLSKSLPYESLDNPLAKEFYRRIR